MRTAVLSTLLLLLVTGCDSASDDSGTAPVVDEPTAPVSNWNHDADAPRVAIANDDPELAEAVAEARRTLQSVRIRWDVGDADERACWAIKWTARTRDGGAESLWVIPITWSAFRIEGHLANTPSAVLECGATRNELVSFPSSEVIDWMRTPTPDEGPDARPEGGYTTRVLLQRFGPAAG